MAVSTKENNIKSVGKDSNDHTSFSDRIIRSVLGRNFLKWLVLTSLVPLALLSIVTYYSTYKYLKEQIDFFLYESVDLRRAKINAYFDRLLVDLSLQSRSEENSRILHNLISARDISGLSLDKFVKTYRYVRIAHHQCVDLKSLVEIKGYRNIYLIDSKGSILFTAEKSNDLGTNIFTKKNLFADTCNKALKTGKPVFSDFERKETFDGRNEIAAFMADVVLNNAGDIIGLIAFQIDTAEMNQIVAHQSRAYSTFDTYLIGADLKMRTDSILDDEQTALEDIVDTPQTRQWKKKNELSAAKPDRTNPDLSETIIYQGRKGYDVIGLYEDLNIAATHFAIVAEMSFNEAFYQVRLIKVISISTLIGVLIIVFFLAFYQTREIIVPIVNISVWVKRVAQGDLAHQEVPRPKNEIGEMVEGISVMVDSFRDIVKRGNAIAEGDFQTKITLRSQKDELGSALLKMTQTLQTIALQADTISQGDYTKDVKPRSDKDILGTALQKMTESLREASEEDKHNNWLKNGQMELADRVRGDKGLKTLAEDIITFLAGYVDAQVGLLYITDEDKKLSLTGSFALPESFTVTRIDSGQGIIGEALATKQPQMVMIPKDNIVVDTGFGNVYPKKIMAYPVCHQDQVVSVIVIGSLSDFPETTREFIDLVAESIAIAINASLEREKTKTLLAKTQAQAKELQAQQEKLKQTNEELAEQTQMLKSSEEELKQQSEELKASNEGLEKSRKELKRQKEDVLAAKNDAEVKAGELELASKYKSEFLANMSHELRTPLNSLLLLSKGLAANKKGNLSKDQVEDAQVMYDSGNSLLALINDIMDLSKVEAGMLNVIIEDVNVDLLARNLHKVFDPIANDKNLSFNIEIENNAPEMLRSDSQRLEQILKNLLSNSMKFTENGSVTLKITLPEPGVGFKQSVLSVDNAIAFAVIDTGVGIPIDRQQEIFKAFQQKDGSTSRKYGGTGLGLTISKELANLLGGEIQLRSILNEGSTFTLYLPGVVDQKTLYQPLPAALSHSQEKQRPIKSIDSAMGLQPASQFISDDRNYIHEGDKTLLIIEDDDAFAKILRDHGRQNGYKCIVAGDGRSGIYWAAEHQPDGILLDIGLPDILGHQVLAQLKFSLKTRHIPVQILSGRDKDQNKSLIQGAIGYLTKPVNEESLNSVLKRIGEIAKSDISNILIIEDDEDSGRAITNLLKGSGMEIKYVGTGKEGCAEILSNKYDCVILDLRLPDMSGFDVLKSINENNSDELPPIIIYTGKEITNEEQIELDKYSASIIIKGAGSPERLLDDVSLFLHSVESRFKDDRRESIRMLHDEDAVLRGRKILLVDDDMRNTYALSKELIEVGFNVEMAQDGKEALDILEKDHSYALVLMDIMMPNMDGYEATENIRKMPHYQDIPIIALTAKAMPEDRDKCLTAGASEYLMKPIDLEKLLSIMRIWLFT